jgi:hypothetical protein
MKLSAEQEAMLLDGARSVPEDRRDEYFRMVADTLRDERDARGGNRNQTVKRAVTSARWKCGANTLSDVDSPWPERDHAPISAQVSPA